MIVLRVDPRSPAGRPPGVCGTGVSIGAFGECAADARHLATGSVIPGTRSMADRWLLVVGSSGAETLLVYTSSAAREE